MSSTVTIENLYKIFGGSPDQARQRLEQGATKDEILEQTGNVVALNNVSFAVEAGEIFVVMGLSGSGKSTLIRCVNRILEPTSGRICLDGEDILQVDRRRLRDLRRTKLSMVFQHFGLFPHKTVLANVEYGLKMQGMKPSARRPKAMEALEMVGLGGWADRKPANLSGGMQQRVGLARALATDPDVLLMDEAFSALDPLIRREMQDELLELQRTLHKTVIFITHDLNEALKLGDRTAVMRDGAIVQIGTPEQIVSEPADDYVAAFTQDVDRGRVLTVGSVMTHGETLRRDRDTVRTAMARMRSLDEDWMYVLDPSGGPVGLVSSRSVAVAVREGVGSLGEICETDFPTAHPAATLMDIYPQCASGQPVAVVNDSGRFIGIVNQLDVLSNLSLASSRNGSSDGATVMNGSSGNPEPEAKGVSVA